MKNIEPKGPPTGLKEILAIRIHLARDHGIYRDTIQAAELRVDEEAVEIASGRTIRIDIDRNERWLAKPRTG
jgi:hypothetical protein